jgi:hypothetical protein
MKEKGCTTLSHSGKSDHCRDPVVRWANKRFGVRRLGGVCGVFKSEEACFVVVRIRLLYLRRNLCPWRLFAEECLVSGHPWRRMDLLLMLYLHINLCPWRIAAEGLGVSYSGHANSMLVRASGLRYLQPVPIL